MARASATTLPSSLLFDALTLVPSMLYAVDATGTVVFAGPGLSELCGAEAEISGQCQSRLFEADTPDARSTLSAILDESGVEDAALVLRAASGRGLPVRATSRRVVCGDGVALIVVQLTDDRPTQAVADQMTVLAERHEARALERSRRLAELNHAVRTPMNAIVGFAQLLKLSKLDARPKRQVDAILNASGALMELLTEFMDLGDLDHPAARIDATGFAPRSLFTHIFDWWHMSASNRAIQMIMSVDDGLPARVIGDPLRIQQVINALLSNAVKYTDAGSISMNVACIANGDGTVSLRCEVSDTGAGMSAEMLERAFSTDGNRAEADASAFLEGKRGLATARAIVRAIGGKLTARSTVGEGTSVVFTTDLDIEAQRPEPDPPISGRSHVAPSRTLRILVADDNSLNQDIMRDILSTFGHSVSIAVNGTDAVEAAAREEFDLILLDVMMPVLDGLGAARQIRAAKARSSEAPIVACSGYVTEAAQTLFTEAGIDAFLSKPIDAKALNALINTLLSDRVQSN